MGRGRWCDIIVLNVHAPTQDKIVGLMIRQMKIHTAEPLVPESNPFEVEMCTEMLKKDKSPGSDQIPAECIFYS
jgi:hypothetical protein